MATEASARSDTGSKARDHAPAPRWLFWTTVIVFIVIVAIGASGGVRGSDQYWYLSDTETLLEGGPHLSNCAYPRQLLVQGVAPSPFLHDILPQRAVVPIARVVGPYWGWIVMNTLAVVAGAWLLRTAARRVSTPLIADCAGALLLLLPGSITYAMQVLSEASIIPLLMAVAVLVMRPGGVAKYFGLVLIMTLAFMSRFTVLPLLLLLPALPLLERGPIARRLLLMVWTGALVAVGMALNRWIFTGIPIPGSALAFGINGRGMGLWLSTEPVVLTWDSFVAKLVDFVQGLPRNSTAGLIIGATNWLLMFAAFAGAIMAWRRGQRQFALLVADVIAVTIATLVLYQDQARYVLPGYGVLLLGVVFLLDAMWRTRDRLVRTLLPATVALCAVMAVTIAFKARSEGRMERTERERLVTASADLVGEGDVLYVGGHDQRFAHCLRPRVVLYIAKDQSREDWARILAMPRWRWAAVRPEALDALRDLGMQGDIVTRTDYRGAPLLFIKVRA